MGEFVMGNNEENLSNQNMESLSEKDMQSIKQISGMMIELLKQPMHDKDGSASLPFLPDKDGNCDTRTIKSAVSDYEYTGLQQILAKMYLHEKGLSDDKILTESQAKKKGLEIKDNEQGFVIPFYDAKNKKLNTVTYFAESQTTEKAKIKNMGEPHKENGFEQRTDLTDPTVYITEYLRCMQNKTPFRPSFDTAEKFKQNLTIALQENPLNLWKICNKATKTLEMENRASKELNEEFSQKTDVHNTKATAKNKTEEVPNKINTEDIMLSMSDFNTPEIRPGWDALKYRCYNPDDFYNRQFNTLLRDCSNTDRLPFFDNSKDIPSNMLNRNVMKDVNKTLAECHSALLGCKSNQYIFGADAIALGLSLDKTKNMTPLLVASKNSYNNLDKPLLGEIDIAAEGHAQQMKSDDRFYKEDYKNTRIDYQFMYNLDQFDSRSRKKLLEITKPEIEKHQEKRETERQKLENNFITNVKSSMGVIKQNMNNDVSSFSQQLPELRGLYQAMFCHEMAQQKGSSRGVYGKTPEQTPEQISAMKNKIKEGLDKWDKSVQQSGRFENVLLELSYRANNTGNKVVSKDINFEQKHRQAEHQRAMETTRSLSR